MFQKTILFIAAMMFSLALNAQNQPDSISNKSYEYLYEAALENSEDSIKSRIYAQTWLSKAKLEMNYEQMAWAYKTVMYQSPTRHYIQYADSIVNSANKTNDDVLIGSAYLTKATVFYGRKEHKKALDNFILADSYISKTEDEFSIHKVKYGIAQTKYYLGFYDEAISLFRECIDYFKEENDRAYLNSLHNLGLCYNRIGNFEWCTITNQMGIDEGIELGNTDMEPYFIHSEGVNSFAKKRYDEAIENLKTIIPSIAKNKDFANLSVAYFYIGKSYWELKQKENAIAYFKKVDNIFQKEKYIRPDLREAYELLIDFYKGKGDTESQLFYINQLLKADKLLAQNYKYLLKKIVKEYDTKELLNAKQSIESTMKFRTILGVCVISILVAVITYLTNKHYKNKKRFEKIMNRDITKPLTPKTYNQTTLDISPDIESNILKKLEKFESTNKYLEKDMNLTRMATILNTNTKYVTKMIAKHRGKGTIEYITDLKINYIIEILKSETKYRNYTNKALSEEAGFGSTQNFTRAFKERTELSPTLFIHKLKKAAYKDSTKQ